MDDKQRLVEVIPPPLQHEDSVRLFRLSPRYVDIARANMPVALVAAETEMQARLFAYESDPFETDWQNTHEFVCEESGEQSTQMPGDVVFCSEPTLSGQLRPN